MSDNNGKVAIVTGGAQGIGAAYCEGLVQAGYSVVIADVSDGEPLAARLREQGFQCEFIRTDVSDEESTREMAKFAIERFGTIDVLVNNAGLFSNLVMKPFEQITTAEWDKVMAVNVRGPVNCAKAVSPEMRKNKRGAIVNIASGTFYKGVPNLLHYVSSKGAVIAMTRSLARELGTDHIRVNTLAPGLTMTDNVAANTDWASEIGKANVASRALKRDAIPDDLVGGLLYLCSPQSAFVTGQCLVIDGGSVMN